VAQKYWTLTQPFYGSLQVAGAPPTRSPLGSPACRCSPPPAPNSKEASPPCWTCGNYLPWRPSPPPASHAAQHADGTTLSRSSLTRPSETNTRISSKNRGGKYHTPVADWLHAVLRPVFVDQLPDQDMYDTEFDRAEVMLGLLSQDSANQRYAAHSDSRWSARSHWFGRSTWRAARYGNPVTAFEHEFQSQGETWPPLQGNLFERTTLAPRRHWTATRLPSPA